MAHEWETELVDGPVVLVGDRVVEEVDVVEAVGPLQA